VKQLLLTGIVLMVATATAQAVDIKIDQVNYSLGMSGDYVESDTVRARVLGIDLGLRLREELTPELTFHVHAFANFENGSNKTTNIRAEYEPNQAVNLREGGLIYRPWSFLKLEAGAINQNRNSSPLLTWNTAFAGALEEVRFGDFLLRAQQAVPNNNILARRVGGIDEGTPMFFMETAGFDRKTDDYRLRLEASMFAYEGLSGQVAAVSRDFGNSANNLSERNAQFIYGFRGYNLSGEYVQHFGKDWLVSLEGQYLFNDRAPEGRNTGTLGLLGIGRDSLVVKVGHFRNESDTSPAFYNARMYGHNNMQGSIVSLQGGTFESEYFYRLSFIDAKLIDTNPLQADMKIINFLIVRNYEL